MSQHVSSSNTDSNTEQPQQSQPNAAPTNTTAAAAVVSSSSSLKNCSQSPTRSNDVEEEPNFPGSPILNNSLLSKTSLEDVNITLNSTTSTFPPLVHEQEEEEEDHHQQQESFCTANESNDLRPTSSWVSSGATENTFHSRTEPSHGPQVTRRRRRPRPWDAHVPPSSSASLLPNPPRPSTRTNATIGSTQGTGDSTHESTPLLKNKAPQFNQQAVTAKRDNRTQSKSSWSSTSTELQQEPTSASFQHHPSYTTTNTTTSQQSWRNLWGSEPVLGGGGYLNSRKSHSHHRATSGSCGSSTYGSLNHDDNDEYFPKMNAYAYSMFASSRSKGVYHYPPGGGGGGGGTSTGGSQSRSNPTTMQGSSFVRWCMILWTIHFGFLILYAVFLHYQQMRLQERNYDDESSNISMVSSSSAYSGGWFSPLGQIYNPAIGPNAPTLHLFGIYNPILVIENHQYWRILSASVVNSSLVQYGLHMGILVALGIPIEASWGASSSRRMGIIYSLSCGAGAILCIVSNMKEEVAGEEYSSKKDESIAITGLVGAGLMGILCAKILEMTLRQCCSGHSKRQVYVDPWDRARLVLAVFVLWVSSHYLPFSSLGSLVGGGLMGSSCGLYWWAHVVRNHSELEEEEYTTNHFLNPTNDDDDASTLSQSSLQDLEDAFNTEYHTTPPRQRRHFDTPGPPPSSDSKGMDTPLMRRSIIRSPEDDDEEDILSHLNGGTGLKRRKNTNAFAPSSNYVTSPKYDIKVKRNVGGKSGTIQFIGLSMGLMTVSIPLFLMSFVLEVPSEVALSDSMHGCKTMSTLYQLSFGDDDQSNQQYYMENVNNGDTLCGEVCFPISMVHHILSKTNDVTWIASPCSSRQYNCAVGEDSVPLNENLDITRELFRPCSNNRSN